MRFSERLQNLMKEKGVKWKAVSEELKIGINQKRYWETHDNIPDGETLKKLADYFDVGIQYLMGETDNRGTKKAPTPVTGAEAGEAKKAILNLIDDMSDDQLQKLETLIQAAKNVL